MAWKSEKEQIAIIEKIENTWKTDIEEFYKILNENFFNPEKTESEKLKISKRKKIISIAKAHNDQLAKVAPNDIKAISNQKELKKAKKGRVISAQTITVSSLYDKTSLYGEMSRENALNSNIHPRLWL